MIILIFFENWLTVHVKRLVVFSISMILLYYNRLILFNDLPSLLYSNCIISFVDYVSLFHLKRSILPQLLVILSHLSRGPTWCYLVIMLMRVCEYLKCVSESERESQMVTNNTNINNYATKQR